MPPQITSFEPHARQPDSFRKPRQDDLILFSQISSIRNEGERAEPEADHNSLNTDNQRQGLQQNAEYGARTTPMLSPPDRSRATVSSHAPPGCFGRR